MKYSCKIDKFLFQLHQSVARGGISEVWALEKVYISPFFVFGFFFYSMEVIDLPPAVKVIHLLCFHKRRWLGGGLRIWLRVVCVSWKWV